MRKKTVAVLFGGVSPEHGVSLESAAAVLENLNRDKFISLPVGITREGDWYRYDGPAERIRSDTWASDRDGLTPVTVSLSRSGRGFLELRGGCCTPLPVDAVFPVLHGRNGEDGTVQGVMELAGIPLVGCGVLASALCMDKDRAHRLVREAGVAVPRAVTFDKADRDNAPALLEGLAYPLYVKPLRAGSSFGITRVTAPEGLLPAVDGALQYDTAVTVEEEIPGFEVGCAVMGTDKLTVGRVDEVEVSGGFFGFEEKYRGRDSQVHMPARVSPEKEREVRDTAVRIYRALGCSGFARVDMFLTPEGRVVFNEVNTIPGFTAHSRFPRMLEGVGLSFREVLDRLIADALGPEVSK